MNKRTKKKIEKRRREKLLQLLDLALQINGLSSHKKETVLNLPTAFFHYSGHISSVEIGVNLWSLDRIQPYQTKGYKILTDSGRFWKETADTAVELKALLHSVKI